MAAAAAVAPQKQFVTLARPAAGKTFVFLLLANYLLEINPDKDVMAIIFVSKGIIYEQCNQKLDFERTRAEGYLTMTSTFQDGARRSQKRSTSSTKENR